VGQTGNLRPIGNRLALESFIGRLDYQAAANYRLTRDINEETAAQLI
jgi:hypothetical protein